MWAMMAGIPTTYSHRLDRRISVYGRRQKDRKFYTVALALQIISRKHTILSLGTSLEPPCHLRTKYGQVSGTTFSHFIFTCWHAVLFDSTSWGHGTTRYLF